MSGGKGKATKVIEKEQSGRQEENEDNVVSGKPKRKKFKELSNVSNAT